MKLTFVDEVRLWYRMYSVWFFAILGLLPDLYNLAVQSHLFEGDAAPVVLARIMNVIAFLGAASRLVQQKVLAEEKEKKVAVRESQLAADAADPAKPRFKGEGKTLSRLFRLTLFNPPRRDSLSHVHVKTIHKAVQQNVDGLAYFTNSDVVGHIVHQPNDRHSHHRVVLRNLQDHFIRDFEVTLSHLAGDANTGLTIGSADL